MPPSLHFEKGAASTYYAFSGGLDALNPAPSAGFRLAAVKKQLHFLVPFRVFAIVKALWIVICQLMNSYSVSRFLALSHATFLPK